MTEPLQPILYRGHYIDFIPSLIQAPKTEVIDIRARESADLLGQIKWYGAWRKYSFFPFPNCVFEKKCLNDIIRVMDMLERRRKNR